MAKLRDPNSAQSRVREYMREHPEATPAEIRESLDLHGKHINFHTIRRQVAAEKPSVDLFGSDTKIGRMRCYLKDHPDATHEEVEKALGEKCFLSDLSRARKQVRENGASALKQFKSAREHAKRRGDLPGGDPAARPFQIELSVDDRGVVAALQNCASKIGTLELATNGLVFVPGKKQRTVEKPISWEVLAALQQLATN